MTVICAAEHVYNVGYMVYTSLYANVASQLDKLQTYDAEKYTCFSKRLKNAVNKLLAVNVPLVILYLFTTVTKVFRIVNMSVNQLSAKT